MLRRVAFCHVLFLVQAFSKHPLNVGGVGFTAKKRFIKGRQPCKEHYLILFYRHDNITSIWTELCFYVRDFTTAIHLHDDN